MKHLLLLLMLCGFISPLHANTGRQILSFDNDWFFAFGDASSPEKDFGCGTEYFNFLTKAASIHNEGPYSPKFDPKKWGIEWKQVELPHDWVVDLPFDAQASHSHGYKTVGYKYPQTSVGWYRKTFQIPVSDLGRHIYIQFDGIFRNAQIWVNGFYLGQEPSGYATQVYNLSEYLNYGGENLVCVRVDATLEEGWFYEGAGIYRHVRLIKTAPLHVAPFGVFIRHDLQAPFNQSDIYSETKVENTSDESFSCYVEQTLIDASGEEAGHTQSPTFTVLPQKQQIAKTQLSIQHPKLWSTRHPYLYKMRTRIYANNRLMDEVNTITGIRHIAFHPDKGFILNGEVVKLQGVNMHQDHPGVGSAIPDALQAYRLCQLKRIGVNAYRSSHNPMTPEMLDACDSLGILVIEENRLTGINEIHKRLLQRMIERDRNHPSIILWSVGNEEWGIEGNEKGARIAATMKTFCHTFDPTRPMTVATSSGSQIIIPADVAGYNYILQNPVDTYRRQYPLRCAIGSEETSGAGTRGIYFDQHDRGWMVAHNRKPNGPDSLLNCIERGWKFYAARPYLGGLFYWTGFDYRGEPNPMKFPATGSQFGILDYCGFPKDEAYYLQAWWTNQPVLHLFPHWNLQGHEGETIDVWAYSNCDEVELIVNGNNAGRKKMPLNGHLSWKAIYQPGYIKAIGYKNGRKILTQCIETTDKASLIQLQTDRAILHADRQDVTVINVALQDREKRFVPTACIELEIRVEGPVKILGVGNGDPAFQDRERPSDRGARSFKVKTFNGLAQILIQATAPSGQAKVEVSGAGLRPTSLLIQVTH